MHHDWSNLGSLILIEMIPKQRTFRHHAKRIIHKLYGKNWELFIRPEGACINILIDCPLKLRVLGSRGEPHYVEDLPVHHVSSCPQKAIQIQNGPSLQFSIHNFLNNYFAWKDTSALERDPFTSIIGKQQQKASCSHCHEGVGFLSGYAPFLRSRVLATPGFVFPDWTLLGFVNTHATNRLSWSHLSSIR